MEGRNLGNKICRASSSSIVINIVGINRAETDSAQIECSSKLPSPPDLCLSIINVQAISGAAAK